MSTKLLKESLQSFESIDQGKVKSSKNNNGKVLTKNKICKKTTKDKQQQEAMYKLYGAIRYNNKQMVNIKNVKRKFFKHPVDKIPITKPKEKKSVFTDEDFKNIGMK